MASLGDDTVSIKSKFGEPPPGIEPASFRLDTEAMSYQDKLLKIRQNGG